MGVVRNYLPKKHRLRCRLRPACAELARPSKFDIHINEFRIRVSSNPDPSLVGWPWMPWICKCLVSCCLVIQQMVRFVLCAQKCTTNPAGSTNDAFKQETSDVIKQ